MGKLCFYQHYENHSHHIKSTFSLRPLTLILVSLFLHTALSQNWEQINNAIEEQPIAVIKPIHTQYVEEFETLNIKLSDHFSGSLLDYRFTIEDLEDKPSDDKEGIQEKQERLKLAEQTIYMNERWQNLASRSLPKAQIQQQTEPFPRSSMLLDNQYGLLKMYIIDRQFQYISYCFEGYLNNIINERQVQQLDRDILRNGSCSDLKHVRMNDEDQFLILFCLSVDNVEDNEESPLNDISVKADNLKLNTYITVVQIRDFDQANSTVKYITQTFDDLPLDFTSAVRFVGNYSQIILKEQEHNGSYGLFMASINDGKDEDSGLIPDFFWINFTMFDEMKENYLTVNQQQQQEMFMFRSVELILTNHTGKNGVRVLDYKTIFKRGAPENRLSLAFIIEGQGILLCEIRQYKQFIKLERPLVCTDGSNAFFNYDPSALAIHYEPDHPNERLFLVSASPPKVTEYDITDFQNNYIYKIYMAQECANRRYVAQSQLAVNEEEVMLLLRDIFTNNYVIRVFLRETTFFKIVLNDLQLPPMARSPFFAFPNYYFSKLLYRDERTVNITQSNQHFLVVNRSEAAMAEKELGRVSLNNRTFNISMYHHKNLGMMSGINDNTQILQHLASFNLTFLSSQDTRPFLQSQYQHEGSGNGTSSVFYSCGDSNFSYELTPLFTGPDYKILTQYFPQATGQDSNSEEYFEFENSRETVILNESLSSLGGQCERAIIVPSMVAGKYEPGDMMVMICIDMEKAQFTSYRLPLDDFKNSSSSSSSNKSLLWTNNITIPGSHILEYQYDQKQRVIIALVGLAGSREFVHEEVEVHYLLVEGCLSWRRKHSVGGGFKFNSSENFFGYSSLFQRGLFIWNAPMGDDRFNVTILIFSIDFFRFEMTSLRFFSFESEDGRIVKATVTNEQLFLGLASGDNCPPKILVLQIFPIVVKVVGAHSPVNTSRSIVDFDFIEDQYLVIYHNDSATEVFTTENSIDILHKMRLPRYRRYSGFRYLSFQKDTSTSPKRDFYEDTLVQVLRSKDGKETSLLLYRFDESQHNALYVANTSFHEGVFATAKHSWLVLTGSSMDLNKHYLGIITDQRFLIVELRYFDKLKINRDRNQVLVDSCKDAMPVDGSHQSEEVFSNSTKIVSRIIVTPVTELLELDNEGKEIPAIPGPPLNLSIQSTNLGLAIISASSQATQLTFNQEHGDDALSQYLIMDSYMQGYNLHYEATCSYKDALGRNHSCDKGVTHMLSTVQYVFPLDFVTSERWVHQAFPIGQGFYLILDSSGSLYITRLPDNYDADQARGDTRPMSLVTRLEQEDVFGCHLHNQSNYAKMHFVNQTFYSDRQIYLFIYQCLIEDQRSLSAVEIAVHPNDCETDEKNCVKFSRFLNPTKIVYNVIDVDLVNLTLTVDLSQSDTAISYRAHASVICVIEYSYSNLLLIFDLSLNGSSSPKQFSELTLKKWNSATKLKWDTFKVTGQTAIPRSKLLVASIDHYGAILYHCGSNEILLKINLTEYDSPEYIEQNLEQYGPLRVFGVKVALPYSLFVFTNYGAYVFFYNQTLDDEEQFHRQMHLLPLSWRVFRMPFVVDQASVVSGPYGFGMLANSPTGRGGSFAVKLIAFTHYSGMLSKLFKAVDVLHNSNCTSLSRNTYLELSTQDQLSLSFVCESRIRVVRFCLKPNVEINFAAIEQDTGVLQYNDFQIYVTGKNDYSEEKVNVVTVPLNIQYQRLPRERTDILTFGIVAVTAMTGLVLFLFLRTRSVKASKQKELRDQLEQKMQEQASRKSITPSSQSRATYRQGASFTSSQRNAIMMGYSQSDQFLQDSMIQGGTMPNTLVRELQYLRGMAIQTVDGDDESTVRGGTSATNYGNRMQVQDLPQSFKENSFNHNGNNSIKEMRAKILNESYADSNFGNGTFGEESPYLKQ